MTSSRTSFHSGLATEATEKLIGELRILLIQYKSFLSEECARHEIDLLERWIDSYRGGLITPEEFSAVSMSWLSDLRQRFTQAVKTVQRQDQSERNRQMEELLGVINRIEALDAAAA